ncbi:MULTISPECIES: alcohol dehydrogenase catalytic domain-containing protein [unclassified Streptomyces]|uniref:alcohol dehydrogenase catalytic domain-containing protein n=1 Tax=unclassified Streptomyces TaxID=2593676 RepID=UPI003D8A79DA
MRHRSAHPAEEFASKLPIVFCHESGGEVGASGPEVTELRGGDRVAVTPWPYRRDCR